MEYLTTIEVLAIHKILVDRYGGSHGLRDAGALESALYRPQTGYYDDLIQEAAALWESLSQNHPFIDGNKRAAFAATYTFLSVNGTKIKTSSNEVIIFVKELHDNQKFEFRELELWLRNNTI
ncbi:MAG: death-on-curing family protein, death on curing protein [Candidatus Peregrinibacteria bacterium GW2011_GWC2_33_13]|nr:MAG: death-on-curing family protein, death on curing protein [Candidatus Peregrinibacteria bacterium GW2011_GWC2_33_13]